VILPGVPSAAGKQPVHGRHEVDQVRARQISRAARAWPRAAPRWNLAAEADDVPPDAA
jgi:hypothetical protein